MVSVEKWLELGLRHRVLADTVGPSRTKQSFRGESDINAIMRKYLSSRVPPTYVNRAQAAFGDFTSVPDYLTAMTKVKAAHEAFAALPSHVRSAVQNDPGQLLELVFDPTRRDDLVKLGLADATPPTPPTEPESPAPVPPA